MGTFEEWWKQKSTEIKNSDVKLTTMTVKTLCYLAWNAGARLEFDKEIKILQKASSNMDRRARRQGTRKSWKKKS